MIVGIVDFFDEWIGRKHLEDFQSIYQRIMSFDEDRLTEFTIAAAEFFDIDNVSEASEYNFVADCRLSGIPLNCAETACRFRSLLELARFSVLYADKAYIVSPFEYAFYTINPKNIHHEYFIDNFAFAIFSTISLRPLIEAGLINFTHYQPERFCSECLQKILSKPLESESISSLIYEDYLESTRVKYIAHEGVSEILLEYDDTHDEHSSYILSDRFDFDQSLHGKLVDRKKIFELGIFSSQSLALSHDFLAKSMIADETASNNIFSSRAEMAILNKIGETSKCTRDVQFEYPTLTAVNFVDAMKIRDQEWHHIHDFRAEMRALKLKFEDVAEAERIVVNEVAKIEKILLKAKRQARGELTDSAAFGALSILAAVGTSGLSGLVSGAAALLGSTHIGTKAIPALRKSIQIPEEARDSRYYYAWKVGRAIPRSDKSDYPSS